MLKQNNSIESTNNEVQIFVRVYKDVFPIDFKKT